MKYHHVGFVGELQDSSKTSSTAKSDKSLAVGYGQKQNKL